MLEAKDDAIAEFRVHLVGPKFHGLDFDGGGKDWIAIADVLAWLGRIKDAGPCGYGRMALDRGGCLKIAGS
jgi:hypothetical protein